VYEIYDEATFLRLFVGFIGRISFLFFEPGYFGLFEQIEPHPEGFLVPGFQFVEVVVHHSERPVPLEYSVSEKRINLVLCQYPFE
jgi:hypothetical protein